MFYEGDQTIYIGDVISPLILQKLSRQECNFFIEMHDEINGNKHFQSIKITKQCCNSLPSLLNNNNKNSSRNSIKLSNNTDVNVVDD